MGREGAPRLTGLRWGTLSAHSASLLTASVELLHALSTLSNSSGTEALGSPDLIRLALDFSFIVCGQLTSGAQVQARQEVTQGEEGAEERKLALFGEQEGPQERNWRLDQGCRAQASAGELISPSFSLRQLAQKVALNKLVGSRVKAGLQPAKKVVPAETDDEAEAEQTTTKLVSNSPIPLQLTAGSGQEQRRRQR